MSRMKHIVRSFWPIGVLLFVEIILFFTNYVSGTYLMGWDNIMPEFDFKTNIMRNLVGVWQEYRGVGLYDGQSHAAATLHTLFFWICSFVMPQPLLRYMFTFLMHLLGGIGMFLLLKKFFGERLQKTHTLLSLTGAFFYLVNPITIQMFYTPFEAFAVHFASLPWIIYTLLTFFQKGTKRSYILFLLVLLCSTPQFFIPTLFIPVTLLVLSITGFFLKDKKRVFMTLIGFALMNAFWFLPFIYNAKQTTNIVPNAKINQMSSQEAYARNLAFGDIGHVLTMQGYPIDFTDTAKTGASTFMMQQWKEHWNSPFGLLFLWIIVGIAGVGIFKIASYWKRKKILLLPVLLWGISLMFLANNTPGIEFVMKTARQLSSVFSELFRYPFTKFSTLFMCGYTLLFFEGLSFIFSYIKTSKLLKTTLMLLAFVPIAFLAYPSFQGNFVYPALRVSLPKSYTELFSYMQKQDQSGRVALFPQPDFWSWKTYRFGYRGSGFLWYGLPQPLLDRAFDPWSEKNESFYWQLSRALFAKDAQAVGALIQKYDIEYIIIDENQTALSHERALFFSETKTILAQLPSVKLDRTFDAISVYKNESVPQKSSYVSLFSTIPTVSPVVSWMNEDIPFEELGIYNAQYTNADIQYETNMLFSKRDIGSSVVTPILNFASHEDSVSVIASPSGYLSTENTNVCFKRSESPTTATFVTTEHIPYLHFLSVQNRLCTTIPLPELWHKEAYIATVVSRHVTGNPMTIAFINKTARHTEIETFLPTDMEWKTTNFILPPLALDGKGYDVYLANDHIAGAQSINDIQSITFKKLTASYETIVRQKTMREMKTATDQQMFIQNISHPIPTLYTVTSNRQVQNSTTLVLSQAFDSGWHAYTKRSENIPQKVFEFAPFLFGTELKQHVLINNWANGWTITNPANEQMTIVIFFLPQLLEWFGFLLIPIPFLFMIKSKHE